MGGRRDDRKGREEDKGRGGGGGKEREISPEDRRMRGSSRG